METKVSMQNATIKSFLKNTRIQNSFQEEGKRDLQNYILVIDAVAKGVTVLVSETDQATSGEVTQWEQEGIKVLKQRQIEDYLLADDVLQALCQGNELVREKQTN